MAIVSEPLSVLQAWLDQHPKYAYTTEALERSPAGQDVRVTLRVTFDAATNTETVHVLRGNGAGSDLRWSGGTGVDVRGPGLVHVLTLHLNVRDPRILSPRGNDIRTAVFSRVVGCFAAHADRVRTLATSAQGTVIALEDPRGIHCGDEYGAQDVTTDRLTLAADGRPMLRERLSGTTVVERWSIDDLQT